MKITHIQTYLMHAAPPEAGGWAARNWLFVKVFTDEGIYGVGEASGWPRVVETAIEDLSPLLVGEDPGNIERLWHKMLAAMMCHGMTGIVGSGAMTGIEMALWDLKGKALGVPVWSLLGGRCATGCGYMPTPTAPSGPANWWIAGTTRSRPGG